MAVRVKLREVSEEEGEGVHRLAASHMESAIVVQRARVIRALLDQPALSAAEAGRRAGFAYVDAGRVWVRRFNAGGLAALRDVERSGRPATHAPEVKSQLLDLALQKPSALGQPFALWTLERLQLAFEEKTQVHLSDSTIWTWLRDEGLVWKRQQTWFHEPEKHDPEFVEKRGPSSRRTSPHLSGVG